MIQSVTGTLKGYDQLLNLVMDDIEESLRGALRLLSRLCDVADGFYVVR